MDKKIILHAYNLHQGGGKRLLLSLLHPGNFGHFKQLHLDQRLPFEGSGGDELSVFRARPNIFSRLYCELKLFLSATADDVVLCFGSLPPLLPVRGKVVLFLHNKYQISPSDHRSLKGRVRLQALIELWWFRIFARNVGLYVVQTPTMKQDLLAYLKTSTPIKILNLFHPPFFSKKEKKSRQLDCQFLYVASANPNKNHRRLIEAWGLLAEEKIYPQLTVTVTDSNHELVKFLAKICAETGAKIRNVGNVDYGQIVELYQNADVLVYPSLLESLGLPLLEAKHYGLDILAPEQDYVRDLVHPAETFDPNSARSIARAVQRYLGQSNQLEEHLSGAEFLQKILQ